MLGRSMSVGVLVSICLFVLFGSPSHPRVQDRSAQTPMLAETRNTVRQTLPRRFPELTHDVLFGIDSPKKWKTVVFHHSATTAGSAAAFDRYHKQTLGDPDGIKYHFVIGNGNGSGDGVIEITDRWRKQMDAAHLFHPPTRRTPSPYVSLATSRSPDRRRRSWPARRSSPTSS
jgi:hypothetical protein